MTTLAGHPFLDRTVIYDLSPRSTGKTAEVQSETPKAKGPSNKQVLLGTGAIAAVFSAAIAAAMFGGTITSRNSEENAPVQRFNIATTKNSFQLPENYPEIYPGERVVFYYPAPLDSDRTVERIDTSGCAWNVVTNRGSGEIMYPSLADNGLHKCENPGTGREPMRARMIGDNFPRIESSAIKVVEVIDAASGDSMMAQTGVNPLSREAVMAAREEREALATLENEPAVAAAAGRSAATTSGTRTAAGTTPVRVASSQPARSAPTRNTGNASARLTPNMLPTFDPRYPDVIRQVPQGRQNAARPQTQAQINVANNEPDRMVSINPSARPQGDEMVSMSKPPTDLRAITPLEPRQTAQPMRGGNTGEQEQSRELPPVSRTEGYQSQ